LHSREYHARARRPAPPYLFIYFNFNIFRQTNNNFLAIAEKEKEKEEKRAVVETREKCGRAAAARVQADGLLHGSGRDDVPGMNEIRHHDHQSNSLMMKK
jgi:hypothetical protein